MAEATLRELASDLRFPRAPVMGDGGDVIVSEMRAANLVRVASASSEPAVVARCGGSPGGAAFGPEGLYVCNSGGWRWTQLGSVFVPGDDEGTQPDEYRGGRIQRVDPDTGAVTDLYTSCDGKQLRAPADLVFDDTGGFWFTDRGHVRRRDRDRGGVYWARADGSEIREVIFPLDSPVGIALSPDRSRLYVAESERATVWWWDLAGPGRLAGPAPVYGTGATLLYGAGGSASFASMAVDGEGYVCVATTGDPGITVVSSDGSSVSHAGLPDPLVTALCFGGSGLTTAYVTLGAGGRVVAFDWPRPGLALAFGASQ